MYFDFIYLQYKLQLWFFHMTGSQRFDIFIMIIILLNMMTMAIEHHDMSKELKGVLHVSNSVFVVIFTCECVMKCFALRQYYFKQPWNIFDFIVVITSLLSKSGLFSPCFLLLISKSIDFVVVLIRICMTFCKHTAFPYHVIDWQSRSTVSRLNRYTILESAGTS